MKLHIEIDCSPEEARRFMGLPDVTKANDVYVDTVVKAMNGATSTDQLEHFARQLAPMGQMGVRLFQQMMAQAMATSSGKPPKDDG